MWAVWLAFWGDLNTPESYPDRPDLAAANQGAHWGIGVALSAIVCLAWFAIFGEMPYREAVWVSVVTTYLVAVEWLRQGWRGVDSVTDGMFLGLGAALPLVALKERMTAAGPTLDPRPEWGLPLIAATVVIYAAHIIPRAVRRYQKKQAE